MSHSNGNVVMVAGPPPSTDDLINKMSAEYKELEVNKFFRALVKLEGSDLHLKVGKPPCVRVRNELKPLNHAPLERREMAEYLVPMMNDRNRRIFDDEGGADFSHTCEVDGVRWRFRVNLLQQNGCMGLVARRISNKIPDFKGLFLPSSIEQLCFYDQGMDYDQSKVDEMTLALMFLTSFSEHSITRSWKGMIGTRWAFFMQPA